MKMVCKKLLSLVLVALMFVTALPFQASAAETANVNVTVKVGPADAETVYSISVPKEKTTFTLNEWFIKQAFADYEKDQYTVTSNGGAGWYVTGNDAGARVVALGGEFTLVSDTDIAIRIEKNGSAEHKHEYKLDSELSKAPTCTEAGKNVYVCSSCDESYTEDVAATGHKWGEWKVVEEATTEKEGEEKRTCETCGKAEFREIPKLDAKKVTIKFVDTFNSKFDEVTTRTYEVGKKMSLPDAPSHGGYAFKGWYTEENGGMKLEEGTKCTADMTGTYYARYTKDSKFPYSVYLHIYEAGNVKSPMKTVTLDTWTCVKDGVVTLGELKDVIKTYYTAKDSDGIGYDGIYWSTSSTKTDYIKDENQTDRIEDLDDLRSKGYVHLNVWIGNAKAKSDSNSNSSSSNPKTGDTIYMAVTVMGLSAASLAAVYYISKKRAVR